MDKNKLLLLLFLVYFWKKNYYWRLGSGWADFNNLSTRLNDVSQQLIGSRFLSCCPFVSESSYFLLLGKLKRQTEVVYLQMSEVCFVDSILRRRDIQQVGYAMVALPSSIWTPINNPQVHCCAIAITILTVASLPHHHFFFFLFTKKKLRRMKQRTTMRNLVCTCCCCKLRRPPLILTCHSAHTQS